MKKRDLERKINQAFSAITPDELPSINRSAEQKGALIHMKNFTNRKKIFRLTAVAAAFVLVVFGVAGYFLLQNKPTETAASIVSMDVNPGLEMQLDRDERVLSLTALNQDAKTIVGDMDFTGSSMDVAVNAIIGSMLRNGYITELSNSILISVENNDPAEAERLQAKLSLMVEELLKGNSFEPAVISQVTEWNTELETLAGETPISHGKAQLIKQLMDKNELYSFDALAALSVNELNLLLSTNKVEVQSSGTASEKSYIGKDNALTAALNHAKVNAADAKNLRTELDFDDGTMVYDIEFTANGYEYDYEIAAKDGAVLESDKEYDESYKAPATPEKQESTVKDEPASKDKNTVNNDNSNQNTANKNPSDQSSLLTKEEAKSIALKHAGVSAAKIYDYENEFDRDDGAPRYEIEFKHQNVEYSYEVHAETGAILDFEKDIDD